MIILSFIRIISIIIFSQNLSLFNPLVTLIYYYKVTYYLRLYYYNVTFYLLLLFCYLLLFFYCMCTFDNFFFNEEFIDHKHIYPTILEPNL